MRLLLSLAFLAGHCSALLQRIHVVVNPFGGGGAGLAALDAVLPIFEKAGIQVTTLETQYAGHAGDFAESVELLDGFVAIGGDGTAHEIANAMLRRQESDRVPVGIIPAGSGVILCRCSNLSKPHAVHVALCLPQPSALTTPTFEFSCVNKNTWAYDIGLSDAVSAARVIASGATTKVDVMAVEHVDGPAEHAQEFAINICGYGMPAAVLEQANALRFLGSAQYELAGLVLIATGQTSFDATLTIEAEDGSIATRELDGFSFAQGQVSGHRDLLGTRAPGEFRFCGRCTLGHSY